MYYLYRTPINTKKGKIYVPQFEIYQRGIGNIVVTCDRQGVEKLIEEFTHTIHFNHGYDFEGEIKVRKHSPAQWMVFQETLPIHPQQMKAFEENTPDKIKIEWIDERENINFQRQLDKYLAMQGSIQ